MSEKKQPDIEFLRGVVDRNVSAFCALRILSVQCGLDTGTVEERQLAALINALSVGDDEDIRRITTDVVIG